MAQIWNRQIRKPENSISPSTARTGCLHLTGYRFDNKVYFSLAKNFSRVKIFLTGQKGIGLIQIFFKPTDNFLNQMRILYGREFCYGRDFSVATLPNMPCGFLFFFVLIDHMITRALDEPKSQNPLRGKEKNWGRGRCCYSDPYRCFIHGCRNSSR